MTFLVDQTPENVFNAINDVRGWWSEAIEGSTTELGDEFTYRHKDLHYSKHKLVEVVPGKKVVWLVTDSALQFIQNKGEWTGTQISFELSHTDHQTQVRFTHLGLVPGKECFDACSKGWTYYICNSLQSLILTGKGHPDQKEENTKTADKTF